MAIRNEAGEVPGGIVIIGLVPGPEAVEPVVRQLKDAGFSDKDVSVIMPDRGKQGEPSTTTANASATATATEDPKKEGAKTGAATGGIVGGLIGLLGSLLVPGLGAVTVGGVLAATLLGAGAGALTGGLIGALVGLGATQEEAEYFDRGVREGGALVIIQPSPRAAEARSILQSAGADLGPSARQAGATTGAAAGEGRGREASEPWRGNERRFRQDPNFAGPERRQAARV